MFGRKLKKEAEERERGDQQERQEAEVLVKQTLVTLEQALAVRREAREKTQRFVGSMRPLAKAR